MKQVAVYQASRTTTASLGHLLLAWGGNSLQAVLWLQGLHFQYISRPWRALNITCKMFKSVVKRMCCDCRNSKMSVTCRLRKNSPVVFVTKSGNVFSPHAVPLSDLFLLNISSLQWTLRWKITTLLSWRWFGICWMATWKHLSTRTLWGKCSPFTLTSRSRWTSSSKASSGRYWLVFSRKELL